MPHIYTKYAQHTAPTDPDHICARVKCIRMHLTHVNASHDMYTCTSAYRCSAQLSKAKQPTRKQAAHGAAATNRPLSQLNTHHSQPLAVLLLWARFIHCSSACGLLGRHPTDTTGCRCVCTTAHPTLFAIGTHKANAGDVIKGHHIECDAARRYCHTERLKFRPDTDTVMQFACDLKSARMRPVLVTTGSTE